MPVKVDRSLVWKILACHAADTPSVLSVLNAGNSAKSTPMSRRPPREEHVISGANSQEAMRRAPDIDGEDRHSRRFRQRSPTRSSEFAIRLISIAPGEIDGRAMADNFVWIAASGQQGRRCLQPSQPFDIRSVHDVNDTLPFSEALCNL